MDIVTDLEKCEESPLPFQNDRADEFVLSHFIEHIREPLQLIEELHRIAKSEALTVIRILF